MELWSLSLSLVFLLVGIVLGWLVVRGRGSAEIHRLRAERDLAREERAKADQSLTAARERLELEQKVRIESETQLQASRAQLDQISHFVQESQKQLEGAYARLSQEALGSAIERLLHVVKPHLDGAKGEIVSSLDNKKSEIEGLLAPLHEMLGRYQAELRDSEEKRTSGYASIEQQIRQLMEATEATRRETSRVATALANPKVSGTWGEQALRRCVELAGMTEYCDFVTQESFATETGRIRPDMVIRLPNERVIAVDAKAPMTGYLEAASETDEKRQHDALLVHAKNLRRHIDQLSSKDYHESIGDTLDLTVLFLGGEQFLYSALVVDPTIFEYGAERKVFIATPTILVPLLRVVSVAWRADQTEESARRALEVGSELYERFVKVLRDLEAVGRALSTASQKYDEAVRSIDARLVPKARELQELVSSQRDLPRLERVEASISQVTKLTVVGADED